MVNDQIERIRDRPIDGLARLQAIILLGGAVRASRFREAIGRSVLDLPVEAGRTLIQCWQAEASDLATQSGVKRLLVRVLLDRDSREPAAARSQEKVILSVERDPMELRGTGGVLKDLSRMYGADDLILVANAHQLLTQPLSSLVTRLAARRADVTLIAHQDGSVSSLMLMRCGVLKRIGEAGFWDMKEQCLPLIARHHKVEVVELDRSDGLPIRGLSEYIEALRRHWARSRADMRPQAGQATTYWGEDWAPTFSLVEEGAVIGEGARIHDSVVLKGARVGAGAVVVRSVVGGGATVARGAMVAEEMVEGIRHRSGEGRMGWI